LEVVIVDGVVKLLEDPAAELEELSKPRQLEGFISGRSAGAPFLLSSTLIFFMLVIYYFFQ
jgi:hypothetical protein